MTIVLKPASITVVGSLGARPRTHVSARTYAPPGRGAALRRGWVVGVLAILVIAGMLVVPAIGPQARRVARTSTRAIPAGLAMAIHAKFGPGPIGLGAAPRSSEIEPAASGWSANVSPQGLTAHIAPDGAVSAHLDGSTGVSLVPVVLSSGGTHAALLAMQPEFKAGLLRMELGAATGTYKLTSGGLEQQFTINRPLARGAQQLTLAFSSPDRWRTIRAGSTIVPRAGHHGRLAYAGLRATDAHGRLLRSHFAITTRGPEIVTDTTDAAYPITIDPTWTTSSTPTASLMLGISDGYAVALSEDGTTALVGAQSAAYIYRVSGEDAWTTSSTPTATLTDGTESVDAVLDGSSVALSADGTTALVGVPGAGDGTGAAYVFNVASESSWTSSSAPTATLKHSGAQYVGSQFATSVALSSDGTTALIGASGESGSDAGTAYVFQASSESAWTSSSVQNATLTDSSGVANDELGASVTLSSDGTTALVGAPGVNNGTGAADVFQVPSEGSWTSSSTPTATLTESSGAMGDSFGTAVSLSSDGETALIGASGAGVAYLFNTSAENAWTSSSAPIATLSDDADDLGSAVSLSTAGTTALLGGSSGAAYIFDAPSSEGSWVTSSSPAATLTDSATNGSLGASVALSADGTTALLGAPGADNDAGAADVFHATTVSAWTTSAAPTAALSGPSGAPTGRYGYSVALSADGTTALVGAEGAAYIFQASSEGSWGSSAAATAALTVDAGDGSGVSVALSSDGTTALIGDVDVNGGDGGAFVFHVASETSWTSSSTPTATLANSLGTAGDSLGVSVALSSDGTTALVGAGGVNSSTGAAYLFQASAENAWTSTATPTATLTNSSGADGDQFGSSVALSSDGATALIAAAGVSNYTGAAYVFHVASETSWTSSSTPAATITDGSGGAYSHFGESISLSSDGSTALIGAPSAPINEASGAVFVFQAPSESAWTSSSTPTATLTDGSEYSPDDFGTSVSISSDGATALIGATGRNNYAGEAYVFQTSSEGAWTSSSSPTSTLTNGSGAADDEFGSSVALSSDDTTALIGDFDANSGSGGAYVFSTPVITYTLNVEKTGAGSGTVTSTDGAVNCGSTCTPSYAGGSYVTLNAQPGADSMFTGWSGGGCSGTGSCEVEMVSDTTVTATFAILVIPPQQLTVSEEGTGAGEVTSNPVGISCPGTCVASFTYQSQVTLTATPESGGTFIEWEGGGCSGTGTCVVTMSSEESVVAIFAPPFLGQEALTLSIAGSGVGTVSISPTGIRCVDVCTTTFTQGTVVTLTPMPALGTTFAGWSGGDCSGTSACKFTINSAQNLTAAFAGPPSCVLTPKGADVYVGATDGKKYKKHPPLGTLQVAVSCNQSAAVKMAGTIKAGSESFTIAAVTAEVTNGETLTVTVKLPKSALLALVAGARESVLITLTATGANGVGKTTAKIARLQLVLVNTSH
jgi:hypothetical protein